jgi:hypothetical protein
LPSRGSFRNWFIRSASLMIGPSGAGILFVAALQRLDGCESPSPHLLFVANPLRRTGSILSMIGRVPPATCLLLPSSRFPAGIRVSSRRSEAVESGTLAGAQQLEDLPVWDPFRCSKCCDDAISRPALTYK